MLDLIHVWSKTVPFFKLSLSPMRWYALALVDCTCGFHHLVSLIVHIFPRVHIFKPRFSLA